MVVETSGLSLAAVFHTGWANRGRDTLWKYISHSFISQAGKALSRWSYRIGDVIHGGQPPSFDDMSKNSRTVDSQSIDPGRGDNSLQGLESISRKSDR
jgi:hypothetical protein